MSVIELFVYLSLINWSILFTSWFLKQRYKKPIFLKFYWESSLIVLVLSLLILLLFIEKPYLHFKQVIFNFLLLLWAFKALILFYKKNKHGLDGSQDLIRGKDGLFKASNGFGLVQILALTPIFYINLLPGPNSLNFLDFCGFFLFLYGFYIETKSDYDLKKFRLNKSKEEKILNLNLWGISRHPNYFGYLIQWWALYLASLSSIGGSWTIFGPILITVFILRVPIQNISKHLEKSSVEYENYINATNKLFLNLFYKETRISILFRKLIPHNSLTRFFGVLSRSKIKVLKNLLIKSFLYIYKPNMQECEKSEVSEFTNFEEFFTRKLLPNSRYIDNSISKEIISPVDGIIVNSGRIKGETLIQAKGINYSLKSLVQNQEIEDSFNDGWFITIYLAPSDYHRIHFPYAGEIKETKYLRGDLNSVNLGAIRKIHSLYARNERTLLYLESKELNYAIINIGASIVGSIVPFWAIADNKKREQLIEEWNIGPAKELKAVEKGQELGYFAMGSTIILLFPTNINFQKNLLGQFKSVKFGDVLIKN